MQLGGFGLQTVRDGMLRFNAAGPDGLIDSVPPSGVPLSDDARHRALAQRVDDGPVRSRTVFAAIVIVL